MEEKKILTLSACDTFTQALLGGVDRVSHHQALSVAYPIMAFLANRLRVCYDEGTPRWMSGQTWQTGGSGTGKSLMLRALEDLFLAPEMREADLRAQRAAEYSLLSEKEQKQTPMPREEVRVLHGVPTAVALLQQMQVNGGGAIYLSCSECGELGKKISSTHYSLILDMLKKSYDGVGEPFLHKTSSSTYYVSSMKICSNIGGTIDQMYKIMKWCNGDGTLSRGALTILEGRKDEAVDGAFCPPQWDAAQRELLLAGCERLRGAVSEGEAPLSVPCFLALGREVRHHLLTLGEAAADCCSRADERAMALCYLLYVANGCDTGNNDALPGIVEVARWWTMQAIDCAMAMQSTLDANTRTMRGIVKQAYRNQAQTSAAAALTRRRDEAFRDFEQKHKGQECGWQDLQAASPLFANLDRTRLYRMLAERGYEYKGKNRFLIQPKAEK